jgi:hypothetical protein
MTFSSSLDCLHEMLTYCRPHGSRAEEDFIQRYIRPLGMATDSAGNLRPIFYGPAIPTPCTARMGRKPSR